MFRFIRRYFCYLLYICVNLSINGENTAGVDVWVPGYHFLIRRSPTEVYDTMWDCSRKRLHSESGLMRSAGYLPSPCVNDSALLLEKRLSSVDVVAPAPQEVLVQGGDPVRPSRAGSGRTRSFPLLDTKALNPHSPVHKWVSWKPWVVPTHWGQLCHGPSWDSLGPSPKVHTELAWKTRRKCHTRIIHFRCLNRLPQLFSSKGWISGI